MAHEGHSSGVLEIQPRLPEHHRFCNTTRNPSQEILYYLLREMRPGDTKKSPLQTVQAGEGRLFRMKPFDAFPRFRRPYLLEFLLRPDPNVVEQLFGFRSDIHEVRKSP